MTSLVDNVWEITDPNPDIHGLFLEYNRTLFCSKLDGCEVKWSSQMTLCAGLCVYEGYGGLCSIRLSKPLLKFRPRRDLVQTLLHEMIHAFLFVTQNNRDHDAHGPNFHEHMHRINQQCGTNITVYHNFHGEVAHYQQHWWRCDGPCRQRRPFYGWVKRAKNRAPGPNDLWWAEHQASCGGLYRKVKEPEGYVDKRRGRAAKGTNVPSSSQSSTPTSSTDISNQQDTSDNRSKSTGSPQKDITNYCVPFSGQGRTTKINEAFGKQKTVRNATVSPPMSKDVSARENWVSKRTKSKKIPSNFPEESDAHSAKLNSRLITSYFGAESSSGQSGEKSISLPPAFGQDFLETGFSFSEAGFPADDPNADGHKRTSTTDSAGISVLVHCPVCNVSCDESRINEHLDRCVS